ncbi:MAG: glycosyltransferase family 2 protein [Candidatus Latescibacteria bacterium]|nr:glycosyltransferase family 2 protein [Candidatus Latescibacterota bacterium]
MREEHSIPSSVPEPRIPNPEPRPCRLSAIIIARNEEAQIGACLDSVQWVDEVVVVDSGSTDRTVEWARARATKVIQTTWEGYVNTKVRAVDETSGDWVLWVDADERVTPELAAEIQAVLRHAGDEYRGFYIARKAIFLGRWMKHCGWYPGYVCRLFRKDAARFDGALVHESVVVDGRIGYLKEPLIHYTDTTLEHYVEKFNTYTTLAAQQLYQDGFRFRLIDLLVRPPFAFVKMYVIKRGFLDGLQGLILCVLSSCYVFTKYAKLWHLWHGKGDS